MPYIYSKICILPIKNISNKTIGFIDTDNYIYGGNDIYEYTATQNCYVFVIYYATAETYPNIRINGINVHQIYSNGYDNSCLIPLMKGQQMHILNVRGDVLSVYGMI